MKNTPDCQQSNVMKPYQLIEKFCQKILQLSLYYVMMFAYFCYIINAQNLHRNDWGGCGDDGYISFCYVGRRKIGIGHMSNPQVRLHVVVNMVLFKDLTAFKSFLTVLIKNAYWYFWKCIRIFSKKIVHFLTDMCMIQSFIFQHFRYVYRIFFLLS